MLYILSRNFFLSSQVFNVFFTETELDIYRPILITKRTFLKSCTMIGTVKS